MHVHKLHTLPHWRLYAQLDQAVHVEQEQETGTWVPRLVGPATSGRNHRGLVLTGLSRGLRWGPDKSETEATATDSYYYPLEQKPWAPGVHGSLLCIHIFSSRQYLPVDR